MTIYLATSSDGKHTEGIGAMVQYQMACYAAAKMYNVKYAFLGFKNLTHYQYFDITQQKFCDDINLFFSLPNEFDRSEDYDVMNFDRVDNDLLDYVKNHNMEDNIICFISPSGLMRFLENNIKQIEENGWIKNLKSYVKCPIDIDENKNLKVAIHVRKFTHTDCDTNPIRDYFDLSKKDRLVSLINTLSELNDGNADIHIFSQGNELNNFDKQFRNKKIFLHLDEYPIKSLWHMINSDILVAANSSFSFIAHLYGKPITLIRDNFYHKMYENITLYLDSNYKFDIKKLKNMLGRT